jgi:hypothetical protein
MLNDSYLDNNGNLIANAILGRAGVQYYQINGEKVPVLRSESAVKQAKNTFDGVPITLEHPNEGEINDSNSELVKGTTRKPNYQQGLLRAKIKIEDNDAINKAKTTHQQISCGYRCELIKESGQWVDEFGIHGHVGAVYEYSYRQENIRGNHVALVERGRAGAIASIEMDNNENQQEIYLISDTVDLAQQAQQTNNDEVIDKKQAHMPKQILLDNNEMLEITGDNAEKISNIISNLRSEKESLNDSLSEKENKISTLETEIDGYKTKVDELENNKKEIEQQLEQAKQQIVSNDEIANRMAIWNQVLPHLQANDTSYKPDYNLTETDIKKEYLAKFYPQYKDKLANADAGYVDGLWEGLQPSNEPEKPTSVIDALNRSDSTKAQQPKIRRDMRKRKKENS